MRPAGGNLHHRRQRGKRLREGGDVLGLAGIESEPRQQARIADAAVQRRERREELARQRGRHLHGVGNHQIAAHPVMDASEGVGAAVSLRLRGQRTAENGLAHAEFAARNQRARQILRRRRGRLEQDVHALRNDARRVLPERPQRVEQGAPVLLTAAGRVLAEPERQAVDLHVADVRLQRETADQVRPRHRAEQPAARQPARTRAVRMDDPAEGPQILAVGRAVPQAEPVPVLAQNLKPALGTEVEGSRKMQAVPVLPFDFAGGEAVSDAVRHVHQQVLEAAEGVDLFPDRRRDRRGPRVVGAARQNFPIQREQRAFALAHFRGEVFAAVFHIREQRVLFDDVALIRKLKDVPQTLRRQSVRQVHLRFERHRARAFALRLQPSFLHNASGGKGLPPLGPVRGA